MIRCKSFNFFQSILELSKVRITVAVAVTTIAGYILARNGYDTGFVLPALGIFFLACGSSVINHLQERRTDAIMARTRLRPIPALKISTNVAILIAIVEIITGSAILLFGSGFPALGLGWLAMFWYNAVYTNLKRKTPNAVIPGSVIGAIPPLVGWVAAGGELLNLHALMMSIFFFVWQVPHFYLLAFKYGHEYEEAGLSSLTKSYSPHQMKRIIFIWTVLTALAATAFSLSRLHGSWLGSLLIIALSLGLIYRFTSLLRGNGEPFLTDKYFMRINYYVLAVTVVLVADPLLQGIL
jgi:heme o synthase